MDTPITIVPLAKEFAKRHAEVLGRIANQIPMVEYTAEHIVADSRGEKVFTNKWKHSLVAVKDDTPVGLLLAYERKPEGNEQYPVGSVHISEFGVDKDHQRKGIARRLLQEFLDRHKDLRLTVQTNAADFNEHVRKLYGSLGFKTHAHKQYDNRTDVVMSREA